MPERTRIAYRDKQTGRFVSAAKYKRSRAQGGRRFVKQRIKKAEPIRTLKEFYEEELLPEFEDYEGSADYEE